MVPSVSRYLILLVAVAVIHCASESTPGEKELRATVAEYADYWAKGDIDQVWDLMSSKLQNGSSREEFVEHARSYGLTQWKIKPVRFSVIGARAIVRVEESFYSVPDQERFEPGFPFWPSWSVYDSRLPAAMQRFSHCCQVRYSFRCRSGLRMLADHGVPAKPEGPLATPLPRRPSATRVRWLFRAVDVTLRAQVAPKFAAACRRTTSGSDAPPQAATNNIARASRAVRPSSSADAASSSATSF